jgi:tripartite-type tricarboxylate transporter receptor subunit TctC
VRILAQSTAARSPSLPDVPTFEEAGVRGLVLEIWQGVFAPLATPQVIVAGLNTEMNKTLADQGVRDRLLEAAQETVGGSPEQFAETVRNDSAKYERLARELKIKAE